MASNNQYYSSEKCSKPGCNQHLQDYQNFKNKVLSNKYYFTSQDCDSSDEMKVEVVSESNHEQFSPLKIVHKIPDEYDPKNHQVFNTQGQTESDDHDDYQMPTEEGNRRESMTSFKDSDINEGTKFTIPSQFSRFQMNKQQSKPSLHYELPKHRVFEIKKLEQPRASFQQAFADLSIEDGTASKESKQDLQVLSRIDHINNTQVNESKNSVYELEMLLRISSCESRHQASKETSKTVFRGNSKPLRCQPQVYEIGGNQNSYQKKQDSMIFQNSYEDSSPIEFHIDEKQCDQQSQATESIKSYLQSLKGLKHRFQDIVQDLLQEENMNIQQTTMQILGSDEFRRMSLNSGTQMLTNRIIEIRDEYRHVMHLLKSQHQFEDNGSDKENSST